MNNRIKDVLKEKGLTQKELAKLSGLTEVGLSKAINGSATRTTIAKVANALSVSVDDLIIKEPTHYAKYSAEKTPLKLGALEIPCYVLDNGMRVFSGRGIQKVLGSESSSGSWLSRFIHDQSMAEFFSATENSIVEQIENPIKFKRSNAGGLNSSTYGFKATLLIDICSAIIDANRASKFDNKTIVKHADIIIRAVAKTGIIALVDEATGYDKEKSRAKDELQSFLSMFLQEEAAKWVKTFPDQFFEDIYKMHGWTWNYTSKNPGVVGKYISNIVYERLGPIVPKLEEINPKCSNGNRKKKHHQYLSREVGLPKLREHLASLHTIAIMSNFKWKTFLYNVDKVFPKRYGQMLLDLDFGDEE